MLELNASCGGPADAQVLGLDIDIRPHNRQAIEAHPMARRISMIEGSSVDPIIVAEVARRAAGKRSVLVCLDSNHTYSHVLEELQAYAPLVTVGSYCVVFDTVVEDLPVEFFPDRPWGPGDNPKTAVHAYLKTDPRFEIDRTIDSKLLVSVAPEGISGGYVRTPLASGGGTPQFNRRRAFIERSPTPSSRPSSLKPTALGVVGRSLISSITSLPSSVRIFGTFTFTDWTPWNSNLKACPSTTMPTTGVDSARGGKLLRSKVSTRSLPLAVSGNMNWSTPERPLLHTPHPPEATNRF